MKTARPWLRGFRVAAAGNSRYCRFCRYCFPNGPLVHNVIRKKLFFARAEPLNKTGNTGNTGKTSPPRGIMTPPCRQPKLGKTQGVHRYCGVAATRCCTHARGSDEYFYGPLPPHGRYSLLAHWPVMAGPMSEVLTTQRSQLQRSAKCQHIRDSQSKRGKKKLKQQLARRGVSAVIAR
jgi:hypothetical protein